MNNNTHAVPQIELQKGRTLNLMDEVSVHYNFTKKCFSITNLKTGLVVAHANSFSLFQPQFKVSEAGRQRVLNTRTKNVHAKIYGFYTGCMYTASPKEFIPVYYNPYNVSDFMVNDTPANEKQFESCNFHDGKTYGLVFEEHPFA